MATTTETPPGLPAIAMSRRVLETLLGTLSDGQMLHQPTPGGNHALWVMGHLALTDDYFRVALGGGDHLVEEAWPELFGAGSAPGPEPSIYPTVDEVKRLFDESRRILLDWFDGLETAAFGQRSPEELRDFAPRVGDVLGSLAFHEALHTGQVTVVRRSLGMEPALM
jgi:hypothetical protein